MSYDNIYRQVRDVSPKGRYSLPVCTCSINIVVKHARGLRAFVATYCPFRIEF